MTELETPQEQGADAFSEKFVASLRRLQALIDERLRRTALSAEMMTNDELNDFIARALPHIAFEAEDDEVLQMDTPFIASGPGGLALLEGDECVGWDAVPEGDVVLGTVSSITLTAAPSLECMLDHMREPGDITVTGLSLSLAVILSNARYYSGLLPDGGHQAEVVVPETQQVLVPVVYQMPTRVVDISDFQQ